MPPSLPTPPRTRHKRSRFHNDADSPPRKKQRKFSDDDDDETAFWTGRSRGEKQKQKQTKTVNRSPSPAVLSHRIKAPVSPPPSRRPPSIQPARASSVEHDTPVTPRLRLRATPLTPPKASSKSKATKVWPKRDSPNNPFLTQPSELRSEWSSSDDEKVHVWQGTPPAYEEKPTITYVFRGQKATFHNPLHELAPEIIAASKLPIDHLDFEAAEACPPRRLFSSARKRKFRDHRRKSAPTKVVKRTEVEQSQDDHQ